MRIPIKSVQSDYIDLSEVRGYWVVLFGFGL